MFGVDQVVVGVELFVGFYYQVVVVVGVVYVVVVGMSEILCLCLFDIDNEYLFFIVVFLLLLLDVDYKMFLVIGVELVFFVQGCVFVYQWLKLQIVCVEVDQLVINCCCVGCYFVMYYYQQIKVYLMLMEQVNVVQCC